MIIRGGHAGEEVRAFNWSRTPLGDLAAWPHWLVTTVNLVLNARQPMYVAVGPELTVICNDGYQPLLRPENGTALGSSLRTLRSHDWAALEPLVAEALAECGTWAEDYQTRTHRAGHPEAILLTGSLSPLYDDEAIVRGVLCIAMEATGPWSERLALAQERDRFRDLFRSAPGFMALGLGPEHRFAFVNPSYESLVGRSNLVGNTVREALPELEGQGFFELLDEVYRTGIPHTAEEMPIELRNNGRTSKRYVTFSYSAVRSPEGEIIGIFAQGYDVTEARMSRDRIRELKGELIELSRASAMSTLAAAIAHELNQPLAAAVNFIGAAKRHAQTVPQQSVTLADYLSRADSAVLRAGDIIRRLRATVQRGKSNYGLLELADVISDASEVGLIPLVTKGVRYQEKIPRGLTFFGDAIQIQQVLVNLVKNAAEATAQNSDTALVSVSAQRLTTDIEVCVSDNGPGLQADIRQNAFEAFTSTKPDGLGLGLSICRTIIEAHGGRIFAKEAIKGGCIICFTLPASAY